MRTTLTPLLALALAAAAGCSVLVQPNENRLQPTGDVTVPPGDAPPGVDVPGRDGADVPGACPGGCNDNVACTVDTCDPVTNRCVFAPDNAMCPTGMLCNATTGCGVRPCMGNADCDDRNVCNGEESCSGGRCVAGTAMRCDNGQMCDGVETCDPTMGCRAGTPPRCDDGDPCTVDRCNTSGAGMCENAGVDEDRDTYFAAPTPGAMCARGADCNDRDPAVRPGATETCNGRDDNCNGMIDEGLMCAPMNDTCAGAVMLTLAGPGTLTQTGTTIGLRGEIESNCGGMGADAWYHLAYPNNVDLEIAVTASGAAGMAGARPDPVLHVRTACVGGELVCNDDVAMTSLNSRVWIRGEPGDAGTTPRRIFLVVDSVRPGAESAFTLTITATAARAASMCGGPLLDVSAGGTVLGNVPRRMSFARGYCTPGTVSGAEDVLAYNGPAGNVALTAYASAFRPILFTRRDCTGTFELTCDAGAPARITSPSMGMSYIFVDGAGAGGVSYILQVLRP